MGAPSYIVILKVDDEGSEPRLDERIYQIADPKGNFWVSWEAVKSPGLDWLSEAEGTLFIRKPSADSKLSPWLENRDRAGASFVDEGQRTRLQMTIAGYQFEKNASDSRGLLHVLLPSGFLPDEIVYQYQEKSLYLKYPKVSDDRVSITWLFRDHGFGTIVLAAVRRSKKPHQLTWRELDARVPLPYEVSGASWNGAVDEAMRLGVPLNSRNNKRLVFSLHGIESRGAWQKDLSNAFVTHATKADYLTPIALDYGRVRFSRLLSPWFRRAKVTDFLNSYCEWTRRALDARPSIIAHSFGTYVVARSLEM